MIVLKCELKWQTIPYETSGKVIGSMVIYGYVLKHACRTIVKNGSWVPTTNWVKLVQIMENRKKINAYTFKQKY